MVRQKVADGSFMIDMMDHPSMMRNVMVGGAIHHGKTSLLDMLVLETHQVAWDADKAVRFQYYYSNTS
jgi:U5 small nuclear ribonucleoprotein component